ncbi:MAG: hypothetical protein J0M11_06410 [Anaerolineae bacterium]|nr:hypothetical protein [Anaerolineae bacterium]
MNEFEKQSQDQNPYYNRIHGMAQFQIQIAITILPIGAGIAGFISQQTYTTPILLALGMVWAGLFVIALSIVFCLNAIKIQPGRLRQRENLEKNYFGGSAALIIGMLFLVISPIGFPLNKFATRSQIEMSALGKEYRFSLSKNTSNLITTNILSKDITTQDYPYLRIEPVISDETCIAVTKKKEIPPKYDQDTWLTVWNITVDSTCSFGDYVVIFKLWHETDLRGQTQVTVKIEN